MFHFKLQKLLDIEKCKEEELIKELKERQKKLKEEEKMEVLLTSLLNARQSEMSKAMNGKANVSVFVLFESYFAKLNRDIAAQRNKIKQAFVQVEKTREKLLAVFKKRKLLEKLRERYEKEYIEQELRKENKYLDEIATSRFYHNRLKEKRLLR